MGSARAASNVMIDLTLSVGMRMFGLAEQITGAKLLSPERAVEYAFVLNQLKPPQGTLLDIGCKGTLLPSLLAALGLEVYGIDIWAWRPPHPNFKYVVGDIRKTNWPSSFFDWITIISTIEHIGVPGRFGSSDDPGGDRSAIDEMRRILKADGSILMTVPYGRPKLMKPWCRVYGKSTLKDLIEPMTIKYAEYYWRPGKGSWCPVSEEIAGNVEADPLNYALALLVLQKDAGRR